MNIDIRSSWEVEQGWAWPLGTRPPDVDPRIERAPSLRGTPPARPVTVTAQERRERLNVNRKRRIAAGGKW